MSEEKQNLNTQEKKPSLKAQVTQGLEKGKNMASNVLDNLSNVETYNKLGNSVVEMIESIVEPNRASDAQKQLEIIQRKIKKTQENIAREKALLIELEEQESLLKEQLSSHPPE